MNQYSWIENYLKEMIGVTADFKVEWQWNRFMVGEKMLAAMCKPEEKYKDYAGHEIITLKCDPLLAELLIKQHKEIMQGFYMDKRHWISVLLDGTLEDEILKQLCLDSYKLVFSKLTKKLQKQIQTNDSDAL